MTLPLTITTKRDALATERAAVSKIDTAIAIATEARNVADGDKDRCLAKLSEAEAAQGLGAAAPHLDAARKEYSAAAQALDFAGARLGGLRKVREEQAAKVREAAAAFIGERDEYIRGAVNDAHQAFVQASDEFLAKISPLAGICAAAGDGRLSTVLRSSVLTDLQNPRRNALLVVCQGRRDNPAFAKAFDEIAAVLEATEIEIKGDAQ